MTYLDKIDQPKDLKKLNLNELNALAGEVRQAVLYKDSKIGGHVGPNLGFTEATVALHYVFNSPVDKIVFDVSHQSYPHKILTGRKKYFLDEAEMGKISGYTNPSESEHDFFIVGHTSTSVSLACGLAKARDLKNETHNIIAVIGDGSLSGGEAFEGFNNAAVLNSNIIIIVNDNEMSIAENQGGLYQNLELLRQTGGQAECNIFKAMGFDYCYLNEGNSIKDLIKTFESVKDTKKPTVVHLHTLKGHGYKLAEENKEIWHWSMPFDLKDGKKLVNMPAENYGDITYNFLSDKIKKDNRIVLINAATPGVFGLTSDRRQKLGKNYVDVGIAEEHAVAFSSALAKGGCKPVFYVGSAFIQRTYDQLSHDLAINNNPAVILVFNGQISGADATHLGTFDIPLIANIPNLVYLAPTGQEEYLAMLDWSIAQNSHPVVIRVPTAVTHTQEPVETNYNNLNTFQTVHSGQDVAIIALGNFFELGQEVRAELKKHNINATLINPRYITGVDKELLHKLEKNHQIVITLEDSELDGGFGEKIARFYGASKIKTLNYGAFKEFTESTPIEELYQKYRLKPELIAEDVLKYMNIK